MRHFEIIRDPKTGEIAQRVPVYEIDIVSPTTFESVALLLKPDTRTVHVQAFSRPITIHGEELVIEDGTIPEPRIATNSAWMEKRVDRVKIHKNPISPDSELTSVSFISEDDESVTELTVLRAGYFNFGSYSKKDMHPLGIESE